MRGRDISWWLAVGVIVVLPKAGWLRSLARFLSRAMTHRDTSSPASLPTILRYGIAGLSVAIATSLALFLREFDIRLTPFLLAVSATVWYAGAGPGVFAIILSILCLDYFVVPPLHTLELFSHTGLIYLFFFTL